MRPTRWLEGPHMAFRSLFSLLLLFGAFTIAADAPDPIPEGMAKYVITLWEPGTPIPGDPNGATLPQPPEPDVEKLGGRVVRKYKNYRVVLVPQENGQQLHTMQGVLSVQRIWTGEPFEGWDEREPEERLRFQTHTDTNLSWGPKAYSYDGSGNVTQIGSDAFVYDGVDRLKQATVNGKAETYTYDSFGNLTQKVVSGANPVTIPVDPISNRMTGPGYDAAGNVTTRDGGRKVYRYDSLNLITHTPTVAQNSSRRVLYDANDERIATVVDSTLSRWTFRDFNNQILREYEVHDFGAFSDWFWRQDHIRGEGQLIAGETPQWHIFTQEFTARYGGKRHYHLDHLGSVRMVTDQQHRAISEHDFFPYGVSLTKSYQEQTYPGAHIDGMRFAGHWRDFLGYQDVETTDYVDYMHARYYDPNLGRFLSVDPGKDWDPRQPQSWNMYAYVRDNPTNRVDPTGRCSLKSVLLFGPACGTVTLIEYAMERGHQVREGVRALADDNAPTSEKVLGGAIVALAAIEIGSNFITPERAVAQKAVTRAAIVIGHYPGNKRTAIQLGAEFLNISNWTWRRNQQFLRDAMRTGKEILLSIDPAKIRKGSITEKEIRYLKRQGYEFIFDPDFGLWRAIRPST